jgi:hypothetical protein
MESTAVKFPGRPPNPDLSANARESTEVADSMTSQIKTTFVAIASFAFGSILFGPVRRQMEPAQFVFLVGMLIALGLAYLFGTGQIKFTKR